MSTISLFTAPSVRRLSVRFRGIARRLLIVVGCAGLSLGCATAEHRYMASQLPAELQASHWQAPCSVDLAARAVEPIAPKFDTGDEVEVLVANGLSATDMTRLRTTVSRDGTVDLPLLGKIPVAGVTTEFSKAAVVQACHQQGVVQPSLVQVSLVQPRQHHITVTGGVQHPGLYTLPRQSSNLVSALAAAGGLSREAGTTISIHSRKSPDAPPSGNEITAGFGMTAGSPSSNTVQPAMLSQSAAAPPDHREIHLTDGTTDLAQQSLADGDVVSVEHHDPPGVVVTGMVQQPGRYAFPIGNDFRILDAIATAHGATYKMIDTVLVCREVSGQNDRVVIQVSLREASRKQNENILLQPGDIVTVESNLKVMAQDTWDFVSQVLLGAAPVVIK
ncbi:MAG TPA: SLBB domain-containing protein [Planctomycetaceae bacterium]|jgi:polysaccharide export outer membrane protein|nr:SLBB domain-containing protein [Planctomycetaceae bacterium]